MAKKEANLLTGLDGNRVMSPTEAITRIEACAAAHAPIGVKVLSDGQVVRQCSVGTGHRPAITCLQQASPEQQFTVVVSTI
jgi:hypothetical protein